MYDCAYSASLEIPAAHIQTGQQMRQIAQPPSNDVTHTALVLESPVDLHQLRIEQLPALALTKICPDNHIHHPVLVLKCYEECLVDRRDMEVGIGIADTSRWRSTQYGAI